MALSATIYKFTVSISNLDTDYYTTLNLTVAQHPSESVERMMARVMAYCIQAQEGLEFTKGLSSPETPDIWLKQLHGEISQWIVVGEPNVDTIKKATRLAEQTWVYTFNSKSDTWWASSREKFSALPVSVVQFNWAGIQAVAANVSRTMDFAVTITDNILHIALPKFALEVECKSLQQFNR